MIRAVRIDLRHLTGEKRRRIAEICTQYRAAVNFCIERLWHGEKLQRSEIAEHIGIRGGFISCAAHQAMKIVSVARKAKAKEMPVFKGSPKLDYHFVRHEDCRLKKFNRILFLSTLRPRRPIAIPYKQPRLDYWLSHPGAQIRPGCELSERHLILWVEIPDREPKTDGSEVGADVGYNHLIALSTGKLIGDGIKNICQKIARKKPGSKAMLRAQRERENYIGYVLNRLPWPEWSVLVVEDLKNLKRGNRKNRGKGFRKALAPWVYRRVLARIEHKAEENRVLLVKVDPRNTSRECPACGLVSEENRKGEAFCCVGCGHRAHADIVGAQNILNRYLCGSAGSQCPRCSEVLAGDKSGDLLEAAGNSGGDTPGAASIFGRVALEAAGNSGGDTPERIKRALERHLETAGNSGGDTPPTQVDRDGYAPGDGREFRCRYTTCAG